ncbi:MAG: phosphodiester glycosidase family protein [Candidatus Anstonellales archaeon]
MRKVIHRISLMVVVLLVCYYTFVFSDIKFIKNLREIWVETAMTTGRHKWLATAFIPEDEIESIMSKQHIDSGKVSVTGLNDKQETIDDLVDEKLYNMKYIKENKDIIEASNIIQLKEESVWEKFISTYVNGDRDIYGNKIYVNDEKEGILIIDIGDGIYRGKIAFIDDPSRLFVGMTDEKEVRGKQIKWYLENYNAILGINANGFDDPKGHGKGGKILGWTKNGDEVWGRGKLGNLVSIGMDEDNRLVVGRIEDINEYKFKWLVQYKPQLIVNGEPVKECLTGWGIQPRTAIGQREDGIVALVVVDGRQPLHSIGINMKDLANLMIKYGIVNAGACDGGSSTIMAYNGGVINKYSTSLNGGRYLPNAILVKKKGL